MTPITPEWVVFTNVNITSKIFDRLDYETEADTLKVTYKNINNLIMFMQHFLGEKFGVIDLDDQVSKNIC